MNLSQPERGPIQYKVRYWRGWQERYKGQAQGRLVCDSCLKSVSENILFWVVKGEAGVVDVYRSLVIISPFILASVA